MERLVLAVVAVLVGLGQSGLAQERLKVMVVRDDDGTPDEGRGHVSGPPHVALKTLNLDRAPADIARARIMYCMKHNPYDVATKTLYGAAAEGVKWSNFVVTLNGREVLRDSLIKHATEGWHEIPVDPALLARGENTVTMTLDGHGSYFYLGIDRSAPRGRSASSEDYGKTFRPNWLSFGTKQADPGEYMVRLKLWAPPPPAVGYVERNGRHYGWLELEDLFSTTRPHPQGFRALGHSAGVNQPSGGLVAYAMVGSFEAPLDLPADGQWRLWLRGWMDGFRNGAFSLSWDGKPFYASAGRHEFTSDAKLRFDWLDLGTVRLTQGRHVLGVTTTGSCGHMFDVLVLTTDPAYRPDETRALPRMTCIEPLVAPLGVSDLKPGRYMTENPIPWAKPLAGGPLRTLWVCGNINEREIVELQQRLDMTADVISSDMAYYGKSVFGSDLDMDQGDLLYDLLVSDKRYDVVVLVRTKLDQIPNHAMAELLRRVEAGMGLIVVKSLREGDAETKLSALVKEVKPLNLSAFRAPFDLKGQAVVAWRAYGKGRILLRAYALWGAVDYLGSITMRDYDDLRFPFWEYQFGHWVKLLQRAGQRDAARFTGVAVPEVVPPGQQADMTVATEGHGGTQVGGVVWAPHQPGWTTWGPAPCAGGATVKLPVEVEDGLYHVEANLLNASGEVLDSAATFYRVRQPARVVEMNAAYTDEGGGQAVVTLVTTNTGTATQLPARLEVRGARERLLAAKDLSLEFAAGNAEAKVHVPVMPSWERLLEARLVVGGAGLSARQRVHRLLLRPQDAVFDDYISFTGTHENMEAPTYCWPVYSRLYDDMGMQADYPGRMFPASLYSGKATAVAYGLTHAGNCANAGPNGERVPCLHDPKVWAKEEPSLRQLAKRFAKFSPLTLGICDEVEICRYDEACFSEHTLAAFREQLRQDYGTIENLNGAWQTQFADWNAVAPWTAAQARRRPQNIAPWLEFRVFMARTILDAMVRMQRWVKEGAPAAHTGGANPIDESYTSCTILSQLYPALDYAQVYARFHDRARSWFRDRRLVGMWSGYAYDRATIERHAWMLPAYGGTLMGWFGASRKYNYRTLSNTLDIGDRGRWIGDCNRELQSGIGKLLIAAEVERESVAILSAWRSKFAYTVLRASTSPTVSTTTGWEREFDELLHGYRALLRKLRVPYRFIDEDQVARGELDRYRMLIAPQVSVLSAGAAENLAAFARQHPVIADRALGTYDEHGRRRATPLLNVAAPGALKLSDFGERPLRVTDENLARLRQVVETAGVAPTREVDGESIDFIVRKRLGDLSLLVVFGRGVLAVTPPAGTTAYDARAHRLLGSAPTTLTQERSPAVLAFVPQQVTGVTLTATPTVRRGRKATLDAQVQPGIATVVRLTVTGPDGKPRPWYDASVAIEDGQGRAAFRPALNDPAGEWHFTATDVISGATAAAKILVKK